MNKTRRKNGECQIEAYATKSGTRYRVRYRDGGKKETLQSGLLSKAAANEVARAFTLLRNDAVVRDGMTLQLFAEGFFARRERRGVRAVHKERSRWRKHIESREIAQLPMSSLTRADGVQWLEELREAGLAKGSRAWCLTLLSAALQDALDRDLIQENWAITLKAGRDPKNVSVDDLADVLFPEQQIRLIKEAPKRGTARDIVIIAMLTGIRLSELRWLRWENVKISSDGKAGYIEIRTSHGRATKSGKVRRTPLLGPALAALKRLPRKSAWVVTGHRGGQVAEEKPTVGTTTWNNWRERAKVPQGFTWHSLRHTCATSLLAGWWGHKWSIEEVCDMLGHSSTKVTERYARFLGTLAQDAAAKTFVLKDDSFVSTFNRPGHQRAVEIEGGDDIDAEFTGANCQNRTGDLRVTNAQELALNSTAYDGTRAINGPMGQSKRSPGQPRVSLRRHTPAVWALGEVAQRLGILPGQRGGA